MSTIHITDAVTRRRKVKIYFNRQGRKYIIINGMKKFLAPGNVLKQIKELLRTKRRRGVKRTKQTKLTKKEHLNATNPLTALQTAQLQANVQHKLNELSAKEKKEVKSVVQEIKQIPYSDDRIARINKLVKDEKLTDAQYEVLYDIINKYIKPAAQQYVNKVKNDANKEVTKEKETADKFRNIYNQSQKANELRVELIKTEKHLAEQLNDKNKELKTIKDEPTQSLAELQKLAK